MSVRMWGVGAALALALLGGVLALLPVSATVPLSATRTLDLPCGSVVSPDDATARTLVAGDDAVCPDARSTRRIWAVALVAAGVLGTAAAVVGGRRRGVRTGRS